MIAWTTSKISMQAGDYVEAQAIVTRHASACGRFAIRPTGSVRRLRTNGVRGQLVRRWIWSGYELTDAAPNLPAYVPRERRFPTVRAAKREAERRAARYPINVPAGD